MRKLLLPSLFVASLFAVTGFKQAETSQSFSLKDPKGVSGLTITIDSLLEPVSGHSNGVSGDVVFDAKNPANTRGTVTIDTKSIYVGSQGMTDATHGEWCLDVAKYPTITFTVKNIASVKTAKDGTVSAKVTGDFTIRGITKSMTVDATATPLRGAIKQRGGMPGKEGDLLIVRSKFSFKRSDYKIAPDLSTSVIGDKIDIGLAFVGVSPK